MARDGGDMEFSTLVRKGHLLTRRNCVLICGQPAPPASNLHCNKNHCLTTITITLNLGVHPFIHGFCNPAVPLSVN